MNDPIVLCVNCTHFMPEGEFCRRTKFIDYVRGKHRMFSCSTERGSSCKDDCGPDGKHFQPRQSTTLCWRCSGSYPFLAPACPHCDAANANVDLGLAQTQGCTYTT